MLLKITEHCSMGCYHCMSRCTENNKFMDDIVFDQAIEFLQSYSTGILTVIVSGGEPTQHPKFKEYLRKLVSELKKFPHIQVLVTSNGEWMVEHLHEFKALYDEFTYSSCGKQVLWQITNDVIYYPKDIYNINSYAVERIRSLKYVSIERKLRWIYPQGRAEDNNLEWTAKGPKCFNIRSASGHVSSFRDLLLFMTSRNLNCTPCIEYDGALKMGESYLCTPCSNIWKSDMEILEDIRAFKCMKCKKAISCLPEVAKSIIK